MPEATWNPALLYLHPAARAGRDEDGAIGPRSEEAKVWRRAQETSCVSDESARRYLLWDLPIMDCYELFTPSSDLLLPLSSLLLIQEWLSDVFPGAAHKWWAKSLQPQRAYGGDRQALAQAQSEPEGQVQEAGGGAATWVQSRVGSLGEGTHQVPHYILPTLRQKSLSVCSSEVSFAFSLSLSLLRSGPCTKSSLLQWVSQFSHFIISILLLLINIFHIVQLAVGHFRSHVDLVLRESHSVHISLQRRLLQMQHLICKPSATVWFITPTAGNITCILACNMLFYMLG